MNPDIQRAIDALAQIDTSTNLIATATTAVQGRINELLVQIAGAATLEQVKQVADLAQAEVAKLTPIADALTAMGKSDQVDAPAVTDPAPATDGATA